MTRRTAYALLCLRGKTILGWSVFSSHEGDILCLNGRRYARLTESTADSFEEARQRCILAVRFWCPGLGEPGIPEDES